MSLLSRFFPSGAGGASGNFGTALSTDLKSFPIDILVIGGGGGGGIVPSTKNGNTGLTDPNAAVGGGGGGGRVIQMLAAIVNTGEPYPITIGAGGAAGCKGGTTCFGTSLIAGGGGGGGSPATFGRAQFEPGEITETAGSFGGDNVFQQSCLMGITPANPSYPYVANNGLCKYSGRRSICCANYGDTTFPITYYDVAGESFTGFHCINTVPCLQLCCPQTPARSDSLYAQPGFDSLFDTGRSSWFCDWYSCNSFNTNCVCSPQIRYGSWQNAIFKKINHPLSKDFKYGLGGNGAKITHNPSTPYCPSSPVGTVTNFNQNGNTSTCVGVFSNNRFGFQETFNGADINNFCQAYSDALCSGTYPLINCFGLVSPLAPKFLINSPSCCGPSIFSPVTYTYDGTGDRNAKGAGWVFSPVSDVCLRTAMLSTYTVSLFDDGPGLYDANVCAMYAQVSCVPGGFGVPYYGISAFYPSTSECNLGPGSPGLCDYITTFNKCRGSISPASFASYNLAFPCTNPVGLTVGVTYGRVFTPGGGLGFRNTSFSPLTTCDTALFPLVSAATTPCVHVADWCAAENGQAGSGGGGGGGVNMGGTNGCCFVFRYQFNPTCSFSPLQSVLTSYGTNLPLNPSLPSVCYMRCILPSPPAVAVGGCGGSGGVYIVYPTDYPAATVTGNTAIPSPPAYRVYYWQGTGSITFNQ